MPGFLRSLLELAVTELGVEAALAAEQHNASVSYALLLIIIIHAINPFRRVLIRLIIIRLYGNAINPRAQVFRRAR